LDLCFSAINLIDKITSETSWKSKGDSSKWDWKRYH